MACKSYLIHSCLVICNIQCVLYTSIVHNKYWKKIDKIKIILKTVWIELNSIQHANHEANIRVVYLQLLLKRKLRHRFYLIDFTILDEKGWFKVYVRIYLQKVRTYQLNNDFHLIEHKRLLEIWTNSLSSITLCFLFQSPKTDYISETLSMYQH